MGPHFDVVFTGEAINFFFTSVTFRLEKNDTFFGPEFVVKGYQFEPVFNTNAIQTREEDSVEEHGHEDAPVPFNTDW